MDEMLCRELAEKYPDLLLVPFDGIHNEIGFKAVYYVLKKYGGTHIYIPKVSSVFKECLSQLIRDEYDGSNRKILASKYGITDNTIKNIVFKRG